VCSCPSRTLICVLGVAGYTNEPKPPCSIAYGRGGTGGKGWSGGTWGTDGISAIGGLGGSDGTGGTGGTGGSSGFTGRAPGQPHTESGLPTAIAMKRSGTSTNLTIFALA